MIFHFFFSVIDQTDNLESIKLNPINNQKLKRQNIPNSSNKKNYKLITREKVLYLKRKSGQMRVSLQGLNRKVG